MGALLRRPLPLRQGSRNELDPPCLALSPDARALLRAFGLQTEKAQAPGGPLEPVTASASKSPEQAARLAAVLALFANPEAGEIDAATMRDAVRLATFYLNEALRVLGVAHASEETAAAEALRRWLAEVWAEQLVSVRAVSRSGPGMLRGDAWRIKRTLSVLEEHGWVVHVADGAVVEGKPVREAWRILR